MRGYTPIRLNKLRAAAAAAAAAVRTEVLVQDTCSVKSTLHYTRGMHRYGAMAPAAATSRMSSHEDREERVANSTDDCVQERMHGSSMHQMTDACMHACV
jgi:hypothetical protein